MQVMDGSLISVCLLTYNHAHLIESTLDSILRQTLTGYEIIVSDDCSTDNTWEILQRLAVADPRIRPIRTPHNLGMPGNANFAVAQSDRPYIALLHHDDLYRADLLEKWVGVLERYPDITYVFNPYDSPNAEHHYGPRFETEYIDGTYFLEKFLFARWGCPVRGTAMIRRNCWDKIGGMRIEFSLLADVDMWMRLAAQGPVGYVNEALIKPRHEERPSEYPDEYKSDNFSWRRERILYEIHAANHLSYYDLGTFIGRINWWIFRYKMSFRSFVWLIYAVIRRKPYMIVSSIDSATAYDLFYLRIARWILQNLYSIKQVFRIDK
ncbi:MAG: glycosyltransferase [Candidatus Competibacteraceae bacterium]|nr:MAG: glycosyltransferase [Candidatus Competibacteraceae bacterium]